MESLFVDVSPSSSNYTHHLPTAQYEQVDYSELHFPNFAQIKRLGRGAYGTVMQATYRGRLVAVKLVETDIDHIHIHNEVCSFLCFFFKRIYFNYRQASFTHSSMKISSGYMRHFTAKNPVLYSNLWQAALYMIVSASFQTLAAVYFLFSVTYASAHSILTVPCSRLVSTSLRRTSIFTRAFDFT